MKKVAILGKDNDKIDELNEKFNRRGFELVNQEPDVVICYGGDGMFLIGERVFSGIPKILVKDSDVGNMTHDMDICDVIDLYLDEKFEVEEMKKIKAVMKGRFEVRSLIAVNDIVLRNSLPTEALRFRYRINEGDWSGVLIGDGLVVSTPYGSNKGAYFYSIMQKSFNEGIGVAFNNTTDEIDAIFLKDDDRIEIEIIRGTGVMVADNNRDFINLEVGDKITINEIDDVARRVLLKK